MEPDLHNLLLFSLLFTLQLASLTSAANSNLFREYIGANFRDVTFSDVPINPGVQFHFILSFGIDYDTSASPQPTNGKFNIFWDSANLSPSHVASVKSNHPNVKVGLSLGGWSVGGNDSNFAYFRPSTMNSWVSNAVTSLTSIIKQYGLEGIDIDYEHFQADPATFADCIGLLIQTLKNRNLISFASIAPFPDVEKYYFALWKKYGQLIDYVNFQFYGYGKSTTVPQFLSYFRDQSVNYAGGKVLVSFQSNLEQGLTPKDGFFTACSELKKQGQLHGIFVWDADLSKSDGFIYEKQAQELLAQ